MGARGQANAVKPTVLGAMAAKGAAIAAPPDAEHLLLEALRRGEPGAGAALVHKYQKRVERLVAGALGVDSDLADVVQDVFVSIIRNIHQVKDPAALPSWVASLAVFTARGHIRKRRRWRWIRFLAPEDVPESPRTGHDHEGAATMRAVYAAIDSLPADDRLAFTLRYVSELELTEVAAACQVSLATIKRRLTRAEARFKEAAVASPLLCQRLENGGRFGSVDGKQVP
jgi:RNA polymerase sigma-70 factor (ECF subfamily)